MQRPVLALVAREADHADVGEHARSDGRHQRREQGGRLVDHLELGGGGRDRDVRRPSGELLVEQGPQACRDGIFRAAGRLRPHPGRTRRLAGRATRRVTAGGCAAHRVAGVGGQQAGQEQAVVRLRSGGPQALCGEGLQVALERAAQHRVAAQHPQVRVGRCRAAPYRLGVVRGQLGQQGQADAQPPEHAPLDGGGVAVLGVGAEQPLHLLPERHGQAPFLTEVAGCRSAPGQRITCCRDGGGAAVARVPVALGRVVGGHGRSIHRRAGADELAGVGH
ncbi:hypothetical protein [Nonomuraea salmonea]|uniref:hypothetical protein n=1 Tax=Nonomuraea salmonea TaxID=46181 RepID=UPI0031E6846E